MSGDVAPPPPKPPKSKSSTFLVEVKLLSAERTFLKENLHHVLTAMDGRTKANPTERDVAVLTAVPKDRDEDSIQVQTRAEHTSTTLKEAISRKLLELKKKELGDAAASCQRELLASYTVRMDPGRKRMMPMQSQAHTAPVQPDLVQAVPLSLTAPIPSGSVEAEAVPIPQAQAVPAVPALGQHPESAFHAVHAPAMHAPAVHAPVRSTHQATMRVPAGKQSLHMIVWGEMTRLGVNGTPTTSGPIEETLSAWQQNLAVMGVTAEDVQINVYGLIFSSVETNRQQALAFWQKLADTSGGVCHLHAEEKTHGTLAKSVQAAINMYNGNSRTRGVRGSVRGSVAVLIRADVRMHVASDVGTVVKRCMTHSQEKEPNVVFMPFNLSNHPPSMAKVFKAEFASKLTGDSSRGNYPPTARWREVNVIPCCDMLYLMPFQLLDRLLASIESTFDTKYSQLNCQHPVNECGGQCNLLWIRLGANRAEKIAGRPVYEQLEFHPISTRWYIHPDPGRDTNEVYSLVGRTGSATSLHK
ncbi:MAG: hypothetical protein ACPIOQ_01830 [Promethearchaeia archaeon]